MVNEWTSNDVPSVESLDLYNKRPDLAISGKHFGAAVALGAMVKHLNAHYPKPEDPEQLLRMCNEADLRRARAEADADRWRRAYEIVEGERDLARERLREHLFGVEAEPADPVEQKAAGWAAAVGIDWGHAEPEDVDLLMKVAAHILGQEAGDE